MREYIELNGNWRFLKGDLAPHTPCDDWGGAKAHAYFFGAAAADLDDSRWRQVSLPHDFVSEGEYVHKTSGGGGMTKIPEMESIDSRHFAGGSLDGGVAWYRRRFTLPDAAQKRVYIIFDSVYRNSTVYLNEYYVGSHAGGYDSFYFDITDFVDFGGENVLAVRVDSTGREGWWYEGGGFAGGVRIVVKEALSVAPWGVFVSAVPDDNCGTDINIVTELENKLTEDQTAVVESVVSDSEGSIIASDSASVTAEAWGGGCCRQSIRANGMRRWDISERMIYTLTTNIYKDNVLVDTVRTSFGVREAAFDAERGFFLNGRHMKIQGVCVHRDAAGVGIAFDETVWEERIDSLIAMGANALRVSHHMPDERLLDICDRKGMLVFAETRRMSSAPEDIDALRMLVRRCRNHPCVILWGIGNEEIFSQHRPETARTTVTMRSEIRKIDPTRPVTSAVVCWDGHNRFDSAEMYTPVTKNLDIMGFNYCAQAWDDYHERMPKQPMIITEASSNSSTRGAFETDEERGRYFIFDKENKTKVRNGAKADKRGIAEKEWRMCAEREHIAGIFIWTGFDYRGEPTPLSYPAVYSQFGVFDYCGIPKDNFYYYKSRWTTEPVLHLFPHWTMPGRVGEKADIYAFSNCDEAELFVNGISAGRRRADENGLIEWSGVLYVPGEIKAVGYKDGKIYAKDTVRTTGTAERILVSPYKRNIKEGETALIDIFAADAEGNTVPVADNELRFEVAGGEIIGTGNGDPADHANEKAPVRRAFGGRCRLLVRAGGAGELRVRVSAYDLAAVECVVRIDRDH